MLMVYFLFLLSLAFIRLTAGYDSRVQGGKGFPIKHRVLSRILLDDDSFWERYNRPRKDRNKISVWGITFYVAAAVVFLINLVFWIVPDIPAEPWVVETEKFLLYADTLNEKVSAGAIMLLFMGIIESMLLSMISYTKRIEEKWLRILTYVVGAFGLCCGVACLVGIFCELFFCFV